MSASSKRGVWYLSGTVSPELCSMFRKLRKTHKENTQNVKIFVEYLPQVPSFSSMPDKGGKDH